MIVAYPDRKIVASPNEAVVVSPSKATPLPPIPNYITQDSPANNTRAQQATRTITQDAILSALEMTQVRASPHKLASRKYPLPFLCKLAGAVMDTNGNLLEYRDLMKHLKYKQRHNTVSEMLLN